MFGLHEWEQGELTVLGFLKRRAALESTKKAQEQAAQQRR